MCKKFLCLTLVIALLAGGFSPTITNAKEKDKKGISISEKDYKEKKTSKHDDVDITLLKNSEDEVAVIAKNIKTGFTFKTVSLRKDGITTSSMSIENNGKTETHKMIVDEKQKNMKFDEQIYQLPVIKNVVISDGGGGSSTYDGLSYSFKGTGIKYDHPNYSVYAIDSWKNKILTGNTYYHQHISSQDTALLAGLTGGILITTIGSIASPILATTVAAYPIVGFFVAILGVIAGAGGSYYASYFTDETGASWLVYDKNPTILSKSYNGKLGAYIYHIKYSVFKVGPYCFYGYSTYYNDL